MKKIKKGQEFECIKDYVMLNKQIAYKQGKKYLCELEGCLADEQGIKEHKITLNEDFYEHFKLIENMKNTIETPTGCKIAKTEIIDGNLIVTYERDLPDSVRDIPNRYFYVINGKVSSSRSKMLQSDDNFSTPERAEAILALGQLLELAAYVGSERCYFGFHFPSEDLRLEFNKKYAHLIEKTKKLL